MYREDRDQVNFQDRNAEDVYSKPVRAGKRTYFFDVKSTRGQNDYYLTITESKHKIFLYKEDFDKFKEGLDEVIKYITDNCFGGEIPVRPESQEPDQEGYF